MRNFIAALALLAPGADALLRFSCSQLVTERLDPLVNPGEAISPHVHQVVGGVSFPVPVMQSPIPMHRSHQTQGLLPR